MPHREAQAVAVHDPEQPARDRADLPQRADLAVEDDQRFLHRLFGVAGAVRQERARVAADVGLRDAQQRLDCAGFAGRVARATSSGVNGVGHPAPPPAFGSLRPTIAQAGQKPMKTGQQRHAAGRRDDEADRRARQSRGPRKPHKPPCECRR